MKSDLNTKSDEQMMSESTKGNDQHMRSDSNTKSDEKMKSVSTKGNDQHMMSDSNTKSDEKMKSESTKGSDQNMMSDSTTKSDEKMKSVSTKGSDQHMMSDSNTKSDEKKSESTKGSDQHMMSDSNTKSDEKMRLESITGSDQHMMSYLNTTGTEEKKDTVPELKSAQAVAKEQGKQKAKGLTLEVPENVRPPVAKSSYSLRSSSIGTDVMDMDVIPTKAAGKKRKGMEEKPDDEVVRGSVKAEEMCKCKDDDDDEPDYNGRRIRINVESEVAEKNIEMHMFDGTYDNFLPVMVKVMPVPVEKNGFEESIDLHRLCEHNNIIRIYAVERDAKYYYIAYEKCSYTLKEYLAKDKTKKAELMELLRGIVKGLIYLSTKSIKHGNILPSNIWIKTDGDNLTAKICGLESCTKMREGDDTNSDMHALGLTLLASVTYDGGYDEGLEINSKLTELLKKNLEAYDIITQLLHYKNYPSLTYTTVYHHPIFWKWHTHLRFLVHSFEVLKMLQKENKDSNILREINCLGSIVFTRPWVDMVDRTWYGSMTKPKDPHDDDDSDSDDDDSEYSDDVYGLLKMIRKTYYNILQVECEEWDRERMADHISELYPTLAMHIYMILKLYFPKNKLLKDYYPECNP